MSQNVPKAVNVFSPNLLGAHRYTIFDGIVRPAGGVLRTALPASQSRGGTYSSPSGACGTYPFCVLAFRHIQRADISEIASLPVATLHATKEVSVCR